VVTSAPSEASRVDGVADDTSGPRDVAYGEEKNSSIVLSEKQLLAAYEGKSAGHVLTGKATYYANSLAGRKTASGETYDPKAFTAAHRTLPFGTVVRVVRTDTNRYVYVSITDRGPFAGGNRIIDLSYIAAERLGMVRAGVVPVRVEVLR
jgi:rare lipoprotein A